MHCCGNMAAVCAAGSIGVLTGAVSHLDGAGQDVVLHDLCAQVGVLQEALKVQPKLLQRGIDGVIGGRKQGDARNLVGQDGCACMHSTSQHGTTQLQGLQGKGRYTCCGLHPAQQDGSTSMHRTGMGRWLQVHTCGPCSRHPYWQRRPARLAELGTACRSSHAGWRDHSPERLALLGVAYRICANLL